MASALALGTEPPLPTGRFALERLLGKAEADCGAHRK